MHKVVRSDISYKYNILFSIYITWRQVYHLVLCDNLIKHIRLRQHCSKLNVLQPANIIILQNVSEAGAHLEYTGYTLSLNTMLNIQSIYC
jgi:RIO-like serine/threonine protein kinase